MNVRIPILILFALLYMSINHAFAQNAPFIPYSSLDQNKDGQITKPEFQDKAFEGAFDHVDTNDDGKIDYSEWQKYDPSPESQQHFNETDTDSSDGVSLAEFKNGKFSFLNPVKVLDGDSSIAPPKDPRKNPEDIFNDLDNDQNNLLTDEEVPGNGGMKLMSFKF